jgi:general secretion pathway protein K
MTRRRRHKDKGIALLTTVWAALFLALLAATVSLTTRSETALMRSNADMLKARELAMAAIQFGLSDILRASDERHVPRDGRPVRLALGDGEAALRVQDEMGKMDLNAAPFEMLKPLFIATAKEAGLDAFEAAAIAQKLPGGATSNPDEPDAMPQPGSNRPLQSVAELRNLPGMSEAMYRKLAPLVTVYNREARINPFTAPAAALLTLPGMDRNAVERMLMLRIKGGTRPSFDTAENFLTETEGPVYTLTGIGRTKSGVRAEVSMVVVSQGGSISGGLSGYHIIEMR